MEPKLLIYGLASPSLGCACDVMQPVINNNRGINGGLSYSNISEHQVLEKAINNFFSFLEGLESQGLPKEMVNTAIKNMEYFVNKGYEPTVGEIFGLRESNGLSGPTQDDVVVAGTVAAGGDPQTGKLIASLLPKDFLNNTFGAVFANGFNLSCWNSTFTPSKVAAEVQKIHVPFFTNALALASDSKSTLELEQNFNYLLKAVDISFDMYANKMWNGANWRSCSREAIQIYVDIVTGAKTQTDILLDNLKKKYSISITTKTVPAEFTYPQALTGTSDFTWSEKQHGDSTYRIIRFNSRIEDTIQNVIIPGSNSNSIDSNISSSYIDNQGYTVYLDGSGNFVKKEKLSPQQSGFGIGSMLLLAGAVVGTYFYSKSNIPSKVVVPKT